MIKSNQTNLKTAAERITPESAADILSSSCNNGIMQPNITWNTLAGQTKRKHNEIRNDLFSSKRLSAQP